MKIHLSKETQTFEKSLENFLNKTHSCQTGISFLAHCIGLIEALRLNPTTSKWIKGLEQEIQKRNEVFKLKAIEALEEEWLVLWKSHQKLDPRKALVQIIWFFSKNHEFSLLPFETCLWLFNNFRFQFKSNLPAPKFIQFLKDNQNLQMYNDEKLLNEYIQTSTELDPVYLWDRLCLLERIYSYNPSQLSLTPVQDSWSKAKFDLWDRTTEAFSQRIFNLAKKELFLSFREDGLSPAFTKPSPPLTVTYRFSRKECENHLLRLQANISEMLSINQLNGKDFSSDPRKKTKAEEKEDEVKKHAETFWKEHSKGKYENAYQFYQSHCNYKPYSYSEWQRKIRKFGLDPRFEKEKTRGISKMSS